jgi:hypothetical protein
VSGVSEDQGIYSLRVAISLFSRKRRF